MRSSRPDKRRPAADPESVEPGDFNQLGLDFTPSEPYSDAPRKESEPMNQELIEALEQKITDIVAKYNALKEENARLTAELERQTNDREGLKSRVDAILGKLEGI